MPQKMKDKSFLANPRNKQKFIYLLELELKKAGVPVKHSSDDADYNIPSSIQHAVSP